MSEFLQKKKAAFKRWLALKTEECKDVTPLFSYYYDRRLSLIERLRVRLHLFTCGACTNYVSNIKFMHKVFQVQDNVIESEKIHVSLSADAKERMKKALESAKS